MASAHHVTCIRIAIALLKDRNGVIDVDLPVTGSLDDPQFKLGPLIWKAVLNLMTKNVSTVEDLRDKLARDFEALGFEPRLTPPRGFEE